MLYQLTSHKATYFRWPCDHFRPGQYMHCYYPNLVILPVDNNEHQRIDDVSTDRISYDIRSVETMGFAL